ncbi:hypothetical protein M436DRAFT_45302, partial [Aureobasidium namibiae CBS 147.97]
KTHAKHTAAGIPTWSSTVVLICRSTAYVWQSGRDAQFPADCGRMCLSCRSFSYYTLINTATSQAKEYRSKEATLVFHSYLTHSQFPAFRHPDGVGSSSPNFAQGARGA